VNDSFSEPQFKGWTKPGPVIAPPVDLQIEPGETLDAISGYFRLFQLKKGHRFSTDDVLTAWYGTIWCPRAERVLDLGSGIGSVGMIAAWRLAGANFVTIEAQDESVRLARKSARFNQLESRYEIRQGDFREVGLVRAEEKFDLVLGSPPYFPLGTGIEGDHPQKVACRFEMRGDISDYCGVAARALAAGGWFACVFPTDQLARVERAAKAAGLSIVRRRPIVLREGEAPLLNVFAMVASGDLPKAMREQTWVEPALVIRARDGSVHPEYSAVKLSIGFPP
jgi:tRNA1Val (adenine37-N6)-methyltransferase